MGSWLALIIGPLARQLLVSLGVGIVSYAALSTALNAALDAAKTAWGGIGGFPLAFLQIAGFSTALSVIAGGIIASATLGAVKKLALVR